MAAVAGSGSGLLFPPAGRPDQLSNRSLSYAGTSTRSGSSSTAAGQATSGTSSALEPSKSVRPRASTHGASARPPTLSIATAQTPATSPGVKTSGTAPRSVSGTEKKGRGRSSSIVSVTEVKSSYDETLDQESMQNVRASSTRPLTSTDQRRLGQLQGRLAYPRRPHCRGQSHARHRAGRLAGALLDHRTAELHDCACRRTHLH